MVDITEIWENLVWEISPGSGPGHLALFGYDPFKYRVGRGVLSALGIDFELQPGDIAARANFATINQDGIVADRRAGRIATDLNQRLTQKICDRVSESPAHMVLLRGFERYTPLPSLKKHFALDGVCIADYPMYRGASCLVGMDVVPHPGGLEKRFKTLTSIYGDKYSFYFIHVKRINSLAEDADFDSKVAMLEHVDQLVPQITDLNPGVLVVTADHSTLAVMGRHSWHPVPVVLKSPFARVDDVSRFDNYACAKGILGLRPGTYLMGLALANAGRMKKYGA